MEWFENLPLLLKMYWLIAGGASLFFVIQMIMTFVGAGVDTDMDTDSDGSFEGPFQLFTIRNLVNFLLGFGWGGVCFYNTFDSTVLVNIVALLTGIFFVALFFFIVKQFLKLGKDNSFKISDTLDKASDVYLAIPGEKSGKGKIQISVKGAFHEINAMTEGERIGTGEKAKIVQVIDNQTVLVIKI